VVGGNTVIDPFKVVPSAVNQVINRTGGVKAGDLFTAGSCLGTLVVSPGSDVIARFPGIGEARALLGV
jgi:2-keto-4-pentenoate hydratase